MAKKANDSMGCTAQQGEGGRCISPLLCPGDAITGALGAVLGSQIPGRELLLERVHLSAQPFLSLPPFVPPRHFPACPKAPAGF